MSYHDFEPIGYGLGLMPSGRSLTDRLADGERTHRERVTEMDSLINARREAIQREVARHRDKLEKAEALLAGWENVPHRDPFQDRAVLLFTRRGLTYAALRVGGHWYTTGQQKGVNRATWASFVDWLIEGGVAAIEIMVGTGASPLSELDTPPDTFKTSATVTFQVGSCDQAVLNKDHPAHTWNMGPDNLPYLVWCHGHRTWPTHNPEWLRP